MKVKRFFLGVITTIFIGAAALQADAQKPPPPPPKGPHFERPAFSVGDNTIGFSIGFGSQAVGSNEWNVSPAFALNFDHGLIGDVGPGTIGIGGIVAFQASNHTLGNGEQQNRSDVLIGARGTYHLTIFKNNKWDPYGGLTLGVRIQSKDGDPGNSNSESGTDFHFGIYAGCKYNFKPNFGAFAELGPDLSFFRIGIAYNF